MSDLLVPITLEVLLINHAMREADTFRNWRHTYTALRDFGSPEPLAFDCNIDDGRTGALLHWTLPRTLRASLEGSPSTFPLVPNRWLVTRVWGATDQSLSKSWVIESDCPQATADGASYFLVAREVMQSWQASAKTSRRYQAVQAVSGLGEAAYPVNLGVAIGLAEWEKQPRPANPTNLFLTAVAPGNLEFSAYVPFNEGVFSFFDELKKDESKADELENKLDETTLSYQVTGWYSDAAQDILAAVPLPLLPPADAKTSPAPTPRTPENVLAALKWNFPPDAPLPAELVNSYYSGTAQGLPWHPDEEVVSFENDQLEHARANLNMTVAVANTSVDAFSTLVGTQLDPTHGYNDPAQVVELLRAFHYDFLPLLNEPNGEVLLEERVRQEWFSSRAGGTQWTIVADKAAAGPAADPTNPPEALPLNAAQRQWLFNLNQAQQKLDRAIAELTSRQWDLNAAWWRKGCLGIDALASPAAEAKALKTGLEKNYDKCLAAVFQQLEYINDELVGKVPKSGQGESTNQKAFLAAIEEFAKSMPADDPQPADAKKPVVAKQLKAVAHPRFWQPGNPVALVSHVTPSEITKPNSSLTVQPLPSAAVAPTVLPAPVAPVAPASKLPAGVLGLNADFLKLDPANAPDTKWRHEWHPIYLEWEVLYTAVPVEENGIRNWHFDGTDYVLITAEGRATAPQALSGRSLLSPNAQVTFKSRLEKFLAQYGTSENISGKELKKLFDEIAAIDDWAFLSQELTGFNEQLAQRDTRTFRTPTASDMGQHDNEYLSLAHLIGYSSATSIPRYDTPAQAQGLVNSVPAVVAHRDDATGFPFQSIRSGQFYLNHLILYDKFGRQLDLVMPNSAGALNAEVFPLVRDAALLPTYNLSHRVSAPVQLPPRLLQPARLDLLLVDHRDTTQVLGQSLLDVNPVGGWLIANHLDQSILVFAPDGSSLGEVSLDLNHEVQWTAPPHSALRQVADLATPAPQLHRFVAAAIEAKTAAAFEALLLVIDSTLWTTDPLGDRTDPNLSVFIGRPLALVMVQVQFALYGPPLTRCDGVPEVGLPAITRPKFSIRFGNLDSREDGVIGYFQVEDYGRFNSVVAPNAPTPDKELAQPYVRQIGPLKQADAQTNYLDLAFDGQAQLIAMLVDPRATINATTGILPVKSLTLPKRFVNPAVARMEIYFKVGPLLARIRPAAEPKEKQRHPTALSYLPISEKNGAWSWWEKVLDPQDALAAPAWQGHELIEAATTAVLGSPPATLREGYLQFQATPEPEKN